MLQKLTVLYMGFQRQVKAGGVSHVGHAGVGPGLLGIGALKQPLQVRLEKANRRVVVSPRDPPNRGLCLWMSVLRWTTVMIEDGLGVASGTSGDRHRTRDKTAG